MIAKGDDPDVASFDSRFVEQTLPPFNTNRENDPSASQVAGVKVAARSGNEDAPLSQARQRANPAAPRTLDTEEIAVLVKRGQELLATGDIAAARVSLLRAAEARDPEAALVLAATFDPIVLEKIGIYGMVAAEISSARTWYEKAKEFGSEEAPRRLRMLADREQ